MREIPDLIGFAIRRAKPKFGSPVEVEGDGGGPSDNARMSVTVDCRGWLVGCFRSARGFGR